MKLRPWRCRLVLQSNCVLGAPGIQHSLYLAIHMVQVCSNFWNEMVHRERMFHFGLVILIKIGKTNQKNILEGGKLRRKKHWVMGR